MGQLPGAGRSSGWEDPLPDIRDGEPFAAKWAQRFPDARVYDELFSRPEGGAFFRLARDWRAFLVSETEGVFYTVPGYLDMPFLAIQFRVEVSDSSIVIVLCDVLDPDEAAEEEDDSGGT